MNGSLKERVRKAIDTAGITQAEFADRSAVSKPTISHILRGSQPRYDTYLKIDKTCREIEEATA